MMAMKLKSAAAAMILAAVVAGTASAQRASEAPRRALRPYASVGEAESDAGGASRYIVPLTEWKRSETDEGTSFSSEFVYPAAWLNRQVLFRVGSASGGYSLEVNGRNAGRVSNGAAAAEFNITKLCESGLNSVRMVMDDPESGEPLLRADAVWKGRTEVISQPTVRIRDIDGRTTLNDSGDGVFEAAIAVKTDALNTKQARISYELADGDRVLATGYRDVTLGMRGEDTVRFVAVVPAELLWSIESPTLLTLRLRNRIEGRYLENMAVPVGLREVKFADNVLTVNGVPQSLNVRTVPNSVTVEELRQLREEGCNAVMLKTGEAAGDFYSACDSAGIYAIAVMAVDTSNGGRSIKRGGNAVNDPALTPEYLTRAAEMYHEAKSHASVIAFRAGDGAANGINAQESFLWLKGVDSSRPVIYLPAGREWNNDRFDLHLLREKN